MKVLIIILIFSFKIGFGQSLMTNIDTIEGFFFFENINDNIISCDDSGIYVDNILIREIRNNQKKPKKKNYKHGVFRFVKQSEVEFGTITNSLPISLYIEELFKNNINFNTFEKLLAEKNS